MTSLLFPEYERRHRRSRDEQRAGWVISFIPGVAVIIAMTIICTLDVFTAVVTFETLTLPNAMEFPLPDRDVY